jgi:hypothetical protein
LVAAEPRGHRPRLGELLRCEGALILHSQLDAKRGALVAVEPLHDATERVKAAHDRLHVLALGEVGSAEEVRLGHP